MGCNCPPTARGPGSPLPCTLLRPQGLLARPQPHPGAFRLSTCYRRTFWAPCGGLPVRQDLLPSPRTAWLTPWRGSSSPHGGHVLHTDPQGPRGYSWTRPRWAAVLHLRGQRWPWRLGAGSPCPPGPAGSGCSRASRAQGRGEHGGDEPTPQRAASLCLSGPTAASSHGPH